MKCILFALLLSGCTYSVTIVQTQGSASDVVDEEQTPSADIRASGIALLISVPI